MRVNLEEVPLADCVHSRFNTRKTRDEKQIQRLAERIERNGFEPTRALWGVRVGDKVEVFAGGTRLEACRRIGLLTVPVMIHVGIGDEEVSRRADVDNENDEYHAPVGLLDVWAEYYRLAAPQAEGGEAWKLDRIARAKGDVFESGEPDLMKASLRVRFHRDLPRLVRDAVRNGLLDEGHCKGVIEVVSNIPNWLSSDQAQTELVAEVLGKHVGKSQGVKPTVKVVREAAQRWKQLIALAAELHDKIQGEDWRERFVALLAEAEARTTAAVQAAYQKVVAEQRKAAEEAERRARASADAAAEEAEAKRAEEEREARVAAFTARVVQGDARDLIVAAPEGFHLLLTDPPYGMNFQSNRRKVTPKKDRIANDDLAGAVELLEAVLRGAFPRMADDATLLLFTSWRHEPEFRRVVEAAGFAIRGSLVWCKSGHGSGDLEGAFAPSHERVIHAVKGNPKLAKREPDTLPGNDFAGSDHPTEKPVDLLARLIRATTAEGQTVVDPFAGSGSTLYAAHACGRPFWGVELSEEWHRRIAERLYEIATQEEGE